jgi:hypothetical protein
VSVSTDLVGVGAVLEQSLHSGCETSRHTRKQTVWMDEQTRREELGSER